MHEELRLPLFPSPATVFSHLLSEPEQAAALTWVLDARSHMPGITRSNVGGWHSPPDLMQHPAAALQPLWRAVAAAVRRHHSALMPPGADLSVPQLSLQAWAMVMEAGHYTMPHDHVEATWSGVVYLDAGDSPSGQLTLCSPLGGRAAVSGLPDLQSSFVFPPQDNHLIVFPGWLQHYVHPYQGSRPRVSVAFNALIRPR